MVKKSQSTNADSNMGNAPFSNTVKDSAQQIWLAGLGAFSKAQEEGGKVFEALVKEGVALQRKTQAVAEEKITEATSRVTTLASGIGSKAQGPWDKLENIFEERVAKALAHLGVPSARDIQALNARLDALEKAQRPTPTKTAARPAANASARKSATARAAATNPGGVTRAAAKAAPAGKAPSGRGGSGGSSAN
jgi:poly(hydroxyalkanoate) granule-associated protein